VSTQFANKLQCKGRFTNVNVVMCIVCSLLCIWEMHVFFCVFFFYRSFFVCLFVGLFANEEGRGVVLSIYRALLLTAL